MEQPTQQHVLPPAPPKNWLVEAILVTIFCCLPFGIVGIVNAAQVNSRINTGDYEVALRASKQAGKWTKIRLLVGIAAVIIYIISIFLFGATALWATRHEYKY